MFVRKEGAEFGGWTSLGERREMDTVQEVFGATSVGLTALLLFCGLCLFLRWFFFVVQRRSFPEVRLPQLTTVHASVLFPIVFGFGLMIQDVADHLTDTGPGDRYHERGFVLRLIVDTLGSEGGHRLRVLFQDKRLRQTSPLWENMLPQKEHFRRILKSTYSDDDGATEQFLRDLADFVEDRRPQEAERYVNVLFYEAKNWAYSQQTYFTELESIQRRIDFARGIFLVALAGIVLGVVATLLCAIAFCSNCQRTRQPQEAAKRRSRNRNSIANVAAGVLVIAALLAGVAVLAAVAYTNAQVFFNERAFGYFVSHLQYQTLIAPELPGAGSGQ